MFEQHKYKKLKIIYFQIKNKTAKKKHILSSKVKRNQPDRCKFCKALIEGCKS